MGLTQKIDSPTLSLDLLFLVQVLSIDGGHISIYLRPKDIHVYTFLTEEDF